MRIISDWKKVRWDDPTSRKQAIGALQYFLTTPDRFSHFPKQREDQEKVRAAMRAFSTTGDFPTSVLPIIEKYHLSTHYDTGYEEIFDVVDFSGSKKNGFDILDVESGLTFQKVPKFGKVKIYKMAGALSHVYFDAYGGALGWNRTLIDDEEYWLLEDTAIEFRNKAYAGRAQVFYALIEALGSGQNISWQNPDPATLADTVETYTANRDAQTLNKAAETILLDIKDKGYGVSPQNAQFIILTPLQLNGRIQKALNLFQQATAGSIKHVTYNFRQISTMMLAATNVYYVILPKIKLKAGYRMELRLFEKFDILSYSDVTAGWMRYGGAIGDVEQLCRCAT